MKKNHKATIAKVAVTAGLMFAPMATVFADKGDFGVDWSVHNGPTGRFGYAKDKFAIAQIGGMNAWGMYGQSTYETQVAAGIAQGKRMHTYIWWENVTSKATADSVLNTFLPQVQTPKGSIVALDVEDGYQNTDVIMYALDRIEKAGYTPMVYGYKNYLINNTDLSRIADKYQLWMAEYPNYAVTPEPNYNYFPSYKNIGIFQFTSTYTSGAGLDGNIDLSGITDSGYKKGNAEKPKTETPATEAGKSADNTPKKDLKVGDTVKVNFSAKTWASGETIPDWVKGKSYTVTEISGNKVLLGGIMSWINKSDAEILLTQDTVPAPTQGNSQASTYTVKYGDTLGGIAIANGTSSASIAAMNGITNPNLIFPGQVLRLSGASTSSAVSSYTLRYGDTLGGVAAKFGTSVQSLQALNGIANANTVYAGQVLKISGNAAAKSYTVRYGDNLGAIAQYLGTSVAHLQGTNGIANANLIFPGQVLNY